MLLEERHWALAHLQRLGIFLHVPVAMSCGGSGLANVKTTPCSNEVELFVKEGLMLKQMAHKMMTIDSDAMEIDDSTQTNKKRKFPDGIGEGVSLLQNGLRLITSGLSFWQQNQLDYFDSVL
ncbi:hypothetical protein Tco_1543657 [Tanacetum coccineum]